MLKHVFQIEAYVLQSYVLEFVDRAWGNDIEELAYVPRGHYSLLVNVENFVQRRLTEFSEDFLTYLGKSVEH